MTHHRHSSADDAARRPRATAAGPVWWPLALALPCAAAGLALALQHPLSAAVAAPLFVLATLAFTRWPAAWLTALPALLPVIGLAPWTGWLSFEEWDLLALAAAAGGYARLALDRKPFPTQTHAGRRPLLAGLFVLLYAVALLASTARGLQGAGGWEWGLFQGYREPMNSIRLARSLFAALLLFPLWTAQRRLDEPRATRRLSDGLVLALLSTSLAAAWERSAFTDLLNFSSDYRTTALFWEMHVGGAALDGMLAIGSPFLVGALLRGGPARRWALLAASVPLAAYVALTTFSRGVYLAVPLGVGLTWLLHTRQTSPPSMCPNAGRVRDTGLAIGLVVAFTGAAAWLFPSSGYRGLIALLACSATLLALPGALRQQTRRVLVIGLAGGLCLAGLAAGATLAAPRLVYVAFGLLALLAGTSLLWRAFQPGSPGQDVAASVALAGFVALLPCMVWVAGHWGGSAAAAAAWPVALALPLLLLAATLPAKDWWPVRWRWQAATAAGMSFAGIVVAAFLAGGYMTGRFATSGEDFAGRIAHWRHGLSVLNGPLDWTLGRGTGRFVDEQAFLAPADNKPGDYRLHAENGQHHLTLVAGTHVLGWGEVQRLSQRIAPPSGLPVLTLDVRSEQAVVLHVDICFKHLLYDGGCAVKQLRLPAKPGQWQHARLSFDNEVQASNASALPRSVVFSVASEVPGQRVDIDNLDLRDGHGDTLLRNGGFEQNLSRWFMTSDRHHMPWHMKNMAAHVLFEQGLAGLALLTCLVAGALVRTLFGSARGHALAPAVAGGLAGFLVVGLFDSLLDVPRVAFLFYFLALLGLTLKAPPTTHAPEQQHPDPRSP